jgi:hypothetical protein
MHEKSRPGALTLLLALGFGAWAGTPIVESDNPAAIAFARYVAGPAQMRPWNLETLEIEASLPRLKKQGRLRAFRRLLPIGKPQYDVLETVGDDTVKRQVIFRYLSAELRAAEIPASSVAITPSNYKFHYRAALKTDERSIYIFTITPRKKREGLIQGELWLDGATGVPLRQSGRLVKSPSIFLRRVDVTREIALRAHSTESRVTHLTVTTRLVGVAELTIVERPFESDNTETPSSQMPSSSAAIPALVMGSALLNY